MPRWSDDPTHVLGVLANYLRLEEPDLIPDAQFARGARAAEAAVTRVVSRVRRRSRLRAAAVRVVLGRARELVGMRETHKDYLAHGREQLPAVGAELTGCGLLAKPEDVFFLDFVEARTALAGTDFRAVIAARREDYERALRRRQCARSARYSGSGSG
jgi:rifampicin phosphotransferase